MNTQEAYEKIRNHFTRSGAQLAKDNIGCFYRTEDGNKCAVGALIPDGLYDPNMERKTLDGLCLDFPIIKGYLWDVDTAFLAEAQGLHDSAASDATNFVVMLDLLARVHNLKAHHAF